jgi:hypothetical protein
MPTLYAANSKVYNLLLQVLPSAVSVMYICMYVCMHACMHACTTYICMYESMYVLHCIGTVITYM